MTQSSPVAQCLDQSSAREVMRCTVRCSPRRILTTNMRNDYCSVQCTPDNFLNMVRLWESTSESQLFTSQNIVQYEYIRIHSCDTRNLKPGICDTIFIECRLKHGVRHGQKSAPWQTLLSDRAVAKLSTVYGRNIASKISPAIYRQAIYRQSIISPCKISPGHNIASQKLRITGSQL